jgi:thioredoxin-like negative regulator of GroEL
VLRRAVHAEPGNPEIQSHLAQALAKQGKEAEARETLRQILSENREFPGRDEAEALLNELGD